MINENYNQFTAFWRFYKTKTFADMLSLRANKNNEYQGIKT